jgi:hypothetical protein
MVRRDLIILLTGFSLLAACTSAPAAPSVSSEPSTAGSSAIASAPADATASTAPGASTAPSSLFHVVGLELRADPADHIGPCPIVITFTATVAADRAGSATYRWLSSDGDASAPKAIVFARPGPITVTSTWRVSPEDVPTHAGWSSIELLDTPSGLPDGATSARADFAFTCDTDDDIESIGFGIGGSDANCSIAKPMLTFAPTDPVRMVANWWPALASGTVVTIRLVRDGDGVYGYPVTTTFHESTKCVHGSVSPGFLQTGHYRLDVEPDTARAVGGEFDVK